MTELSQVSGSTQTALKNLKIGELLEEAAWEHPDNTALISSKQNISLSYKQFNQQADELARGFVELGLQCGDGVGIWSPNNVEWLLTMYAAAKAGLILVNINPAYRLSELEYALNKVSCKALVLAESFKSSNYAEMIRELAPELSDSQPGQLHAEKLSSLRALILISEQTMAGAYRFKDVQHIGAKSDVNLKAIDQVFTADDPVNIQFTSGTTGSPKGATLSHNNIVNNGFFVGEGICLTAKDRLCCPVPLYHCFGMVMGALACANFGATLVLPDEAFDPVTTLAAVEKEKCTALYGVPTMFTMMLNDEGFSSFDVSALRTGIVAGSLCPETLMERILGELNMSEVTNCYGMMETSPVSFQSAVDDPIEKRVTTVGRVHPNVSVKVVDANGNTVPRGVAGELCTKGYSVMRGYWGDQQKTKEAIVDGWMHTGDQAMIDEEGYCAIVGRIKDTIIRGGENIAPKEIEDFLLRHEHILEAQAFGVTNEKFGEIVAVWLKKKPGADLNQAQVQAFCKDQIAHFKVPAIVEFVDEYPLTVTGKVQKFVMRAETEKALGLAS